VEPDTVRKWARREGLPHVPVGRFLRFDLAAVEAWLRQRAMPPEAGLVSTPTGLRRSGATNGRIRRKRKNGHVYAISFMAAGEQQLETVGRDEPEAQRLYRQRKREVAAGTYAKKAKRGSPKRFQARASAPASRRARTRW
jgi:excisionase family DNA binding protein